MALKDLFIKIEVMGGKQAVKNVDRSFVSLGKAAMKAGAVFYAAKGLVQGFEKIIHLSGEQEKAEAKLNAVLKSTGGVAGLTAKELTTMASAFQQVTTFGDEAIIGAQSLLLTFTQVGEEVFPQATETILNMSAAMGQDLKQTTLQLGKALNDPIKGVAALSRVGVQLTETQKDQIETFANLGDVASAQKVILGELETQFGGLARATTQTTSGALEQMKNALGDTAETMGDLFAPMVRKSAIRIAASAKIMSQAFVNLKDLDFSATFQNIISNTDALLLAVRKTFVAYIDYLPDYWKNVFGRILPIAKSILTKLTDGIANLGTMIWEPIKVGAKIMSASVLNFFTEMFNKVREQINIFANSWAGEKMGITPLKMGNFIDVGLLKSELKNTKLMDTLFGGEDNIKDLSDFTEKQKEIWAEYFASVVEKKKENDNIIVESETEKNLIISEQQEAFQQTSLNMLDFNMNQQIKSINKKAKAFRDAGVEEIQVQTFVTAKKSELYANELSAKTSQAGQLFGLAAQVSAKDKSSAMRTKMLMTAEAIMNTYAAASKAFAQFGGWPAGVLPAALTVALGMDNVQKIHSTKFAEGGIVPGTGNQDTVPAMLTPGELILNRAQQENLVNNNSNITINISAPLVDETVVDSIIPAIQRATNLNLA